MKRRTKIATILTTGLLSAALVGVGFAAWTIAGKEQKDDTTAKGTVTADTVNDGTDLRMNVELDQKELVFGSPSTQAISDWESGDGADWHDKVWLTTDHTADEKMDLKITVTFSAGTLNKLTVKLETDISSLNGYIDYTMSIDSGSSDTAFTAIAKDTGAVTISAPKDCSSEVKCVINVKFTWGSEFGNKNPYFHYNEQKVTNTLIEEARTKLGADSGLKSKVDALSDGFKFVVTAS